MISTYFCFFILFNLANYSYSLQTGFTCEPSVTLTCPKSKILVILEVIYSTKCNDESKNSSIYAPSHCIAYYRDRISTQCNGQEICIIDNSLEKRPSFSIGQQANCAFQGQSINIEYSCIPDFYSNILPSVDICSSENLDDIKEGFIHSPKYPNNYPNSVTCSKTIPTPVAGHRLKIYVLDFDIESVRVTRLNSATKINNWLEINNNGEKFYGLRAPYTLLFDDVIQALLTFKSDLSNTKRVYHGFLLYFIVTPIRRSRPLKTTTNVGIISDEDFTTVIEAKAAALVRRENQSNAGLILLVVLLSGILFTMICTLLLYKRRNDRRIRYLTETFNSFIPKRSKASSSEDSSETKLNSKLETSANNKDDEFENFEHIYSQDPLEKKINENELIYETINYDTLNEKYKFNENIV